MYMIQSNSFFTGNKKWSTNLCTLSLAGLDSSWPSERTRLNGSLRAALLYLFCCIVLWRDSRCHLNIRSSRNTPSHGSHRNRNEQAFLFWHSSDKIINEPWLVIEWKVCARRALDTKSSCHRVNLLFLIPASTSGAIFDSLIWTF